MTNYTHIQHKEERTQFFRKYIYLSLYSKVGYCLRGELETEQNSNILTHTLLAIAAFLSRSPGLLNRGPGGPASAGTWFSFQHLLSNWSELPVAWVIYVRWEMHLLFTQVNFSSDSPAELEVNMQQNEHNFLDTT